MGPRLSTGAGTIGDANLDQGHPPPDHMPGLDCSGWRHPAFPRRPTAGEAQVDSLQSPPPLEPPWKSTDLVRHTRTATATATAMPHFRRHSDGFSIMAPSSPCYDLDREASTTGNTDSGGTGGWGSDCGRGDCYRDHRRALSDGYYRDSGVLPSTLAPLQGRGYGGRVALSPPIEERRLFGIAAPPLSLGMGDPHRRQSCTRSSIAAEDGAFTTKLAPPPSWDLGSGGRDGEARLGHVSRGLGGHRWLGGGNRNAGAYTDSEHDREYCHDDRLLHDLPLGGQRPPRSPRHGDHRQHPIPSRQSPTSPPAGTTITPSTSADRCRGGDPFENSIALRPMLPVVSDFVRSPSPLPGLAEIVSSVGNQAAGGRQGVFPLHDIHGHPGRFADGGGEGATEAGAGAGAGAMEWGHRGRRRPYDPVSTKTVSIGEECVEAGCNRRARFAFKGSRKPVYCATHKLVSGMADTRHPLCKHEQCARQPSFGVEGDRRPSYCAAHKKPGMTNVSARRCEHPGCVRHPNFGFRGDKRASFCKQHRETGMVDVVSRRCREPSCMRRPLYNMRGLRPVCCSTHKLPEMIDVVSTRCEAPGCSRHPSFGCAWERKARRCARHRLENMVSVKGRRRKQRREMTAAAAAAAAAINAMLPPGPSSSITASSP